MKAQWPAPTWVHAYTTTRTFSNLAIHVQDCPRRVALNRLRLAQHFHLQQSPAWLWQTHSVKVVAAETVGSERVEADGAYTSCTNLPCVVLTADCLPLLLCDVKGSVVAAVHCGWRGLANGIIENAVIALRKQTQHALLAWLGPCISQPHYEVGEALRAVFLRQNLRMSKAFSMGKEEGKWFASLPLIAKTQLEALEVGDIYGGEACTYAQAGAFYSYRRAPQTGRMATLIWLSA